MPIFANVIQQAFSPLISLFESIMVFIHAHLVGGSWGLAIVGLTVVTRAVLVPVTFKQLKSMQEMQRLAPQMKAIKEKYSEDKQRQQQEIMKFYQEHKINPLASCLPFALQLPVFISLFYMLRTDLKKHICGPGMEAAYHAHHKAGETLSKFIENESCSKVAPHVHAAKFLFIPDITAKATGVVLVVLIALYIGSQLVSTFMATASADPSQRRMMLLLPLVIVAFLFRYPAGLLVYWITTNSWTIVQQYFIRRRMGPPPPKPPKDDANGKPTRSLKSVLAGAGVAGAGVADVAGVGVGAAGGGATVPPPRSPRKKKKRSGRRR
jgi:YidC/Oxa1 family membrane protein insertase